MRSQHHLLSVHTTTEISVLLLPVVNVVVVGEAVLVPEAPKCPRLSRNCSQDLKTIKKNGKVEIGLLQIFYKLSNYVNIIAPQVRF